MADEPFGILVATFSGDESAKTALDQLKASGVRRGNAAVIRRSTDGKLKITETQDWGMGKAALIGAVAAIVIPGVGPLLGAAAGALAAKVIDLGFPDARLQEMGDRLTPNSSAIVVLVDDTMRMAAEQVLRDAGGQTVSGGLDADLATQIEDSMRASVADSSTGTSTRKL